MRSEIKQHTQMPQFSWQIGGALQPVLFLWQLLGAVRCLVAADYFSSITGLEQLLTTEQILLSDFRLQIESTKRSLTHLERELQAIELEHVLAAQDTENYLTNPVNIYRLMKRLRTDWPDLSTRAGDMAKDVVFPEHMRAQSSSLSFPSQDDVEGAALALVRLQNTYKLDVAQVAAGILNGIKYGNAMSWQDCFMLGQQLFELADYNNTRIWMRESLERLRNQPQQAAAPAVDTLNSMEHLAKHFFQLGDFDTAYELSQRVLEYDPKRVRNWHLGDKGAMQSNSEDFNAYFDANAADSYSHTEEFRQYERVCREETTASPRQLRALRCRLVSSGSAYLRLAPIKVEEHNLDPLVVSYHGVLSEPRIETLKRMAATRLQRSTVNPKTVQDASRPSSFRVSKNAWLAYDSHSYMQRMLRDLQDATGLDMTYCEQLQVANYGVGGHYEPHWDFFRDESLYPAEEGNRIATAIFYLSDVELGGATAFPFLNFAVKPQKGNVLFWYNLHRSLDMDYRTKHAGCPVLKGSKWIGNVWIHERTQTFARPCDVFRDNEVSLGYAFIK